ncbi:hypothetical protein [uncultured Leifsonia sp.]|uniref:hypothetical protein n=1 Tax=Leifsonia sp. TaxID=1870902 RepID=UPI0028D75C4D|nr:hypothetical protein [uncultured Leifsonia sp.]
MTGPDSWVRAHIKTMHGLGGRYLYANWDGTGRNNLHDLSSLEATRWVAVCAPEPRGLWSRMRRLVRRGQDA